MRPCCNFVSGLCHVCVCACGSWLPQELKQELAHTWRVHEPTDMEELDLQLCAQERTRARSRLPVFAANRHEWEAQRLLPDRDLHRLSKVADALRHEKLDAKRMNAKARAQNRSAGAKSSCSSSSLSSSSSSSSCSSSSSSASASDGAEPVDAMAEAAVAMTASQAAVLAEQGAAMAKVVVALDAGQHQQPWVVPKGPRSKVHLRVDLSAHVCIKLRRPQDDVKPGFRCGDGVSWRDTGLTWCAACLKLRALPNEISDVGTPRNTYVSLSCIFDSHLGRARFCSWCFRHPGLAECPISSVKDKPCMFQI